MSTFSELIDFTRSSTGTYLDSVVYGDELVTNGTFDADSGWTKGTGWTISGGTASKTAGTGDSLTLQNFTPVVGQTYKLSFDLTKTAGSFDARVGNAPTGFLTAGHHDILLTATHPFPVYFYGDSSFTGSIDNVSVKEIIGGQGTAGTPLLRTADTNEQRLEYDASGQPLGLLIEEQRTNKVLYSNRLSGSAWNGTNCTITTDSTTSPDGNINASKLTCSGGSGSVWQYAIGTGLNGNYSNSIYLKADTLNYAQLNIGYLTASFVANFDLVNGTVTEILGTGATITDVGNGWFRCTMPFNTTQQGGFGVTPIDSMSSTRRSGAVGSVFVYGAQLEQGAFPTSYIPTSGSTVTRTSDVCSLPLERYHHNAQSYTMYAEFQSSPKVPSNFERVWVLSNDDSTSDYLQLQYNTSNAVQVYSRYNSGGNGAIASIEVTDTTNKVALKVDGSVMRSACNGVLQNGTLFNVIEDFTKLTIGASDSISIPLNSHIKVIQSYAKGLTDAQLIELTKPSSSPTMSLTFDGQATSELVEGLHD